MASFNLPSELVRHVAGSLRSSGDLAALSKTNRFCLGLVTPALQKNHTTRVMRWACKYEDLPLLKSVLDQNSKDDPDRRRDIINFEYSQFDIYAKNDDCAFLVPEVEHYFLATALNYACSNGHDHIVEYLLDNGADPTAPSGLLCNCVVIENYWDLANQRIRGSPY